MSASLREIDANRIPPLALFGAGALVLGSLLLVGFARLTHYPSTRPEASPVVQRSELRFEDRPDGAVLIYLEPQDRLVDTLAPGTNGFVRGVMRGLVRDRRAGRIGPEPAFVLTRWADGRLSLDDPTTKRHVDLEVFGPTNAGAFAQILIASTQPGE